MCEPREKDESGLVCFGASVRCYASNPIIQATSNPNQANVYQRGTQHDSLNGTNKDLGYRCHDANGRPVTPDGQPIVITLTQADFAALPVQPAVAHAGPPGGTLPVNMDLIAHAEPSDQTLNTTLLGTPVAVRAIPVEYTWDFGDGNRLTTIRPGRPYPHKDVVHRYQHEGWYDVTLTTTYAGQFSVNGGPWQDIQGTIEVASPPIAVYSRSYESRLTDGAGEHAPADDPAPPPRGPDTEGPQDPHPTQRRG